MGRVAPGSTSTGGGTLKEGAAKSEIVVFCSSNMISYDNVGENGSRILHFTINN